MEDATTRWQSLTLEGWYGQQTYTFAWVSQTAVWHHTGLPPVPIRWVLVRDPMGKLEPQAFLCTDLEATPAQILLWFRQRWQVEVTFQEVRAHLGVETQRQWSDFAIQRHHTCPARTLLPRRTPHPASAPAIYVLPASYRLVGEATPDLR